MPVVYIINQPKQRKGDLHSYDISPCLKYGDVKYVFGTSDVPPSHNPGLAEHVAHEVLRDMQPDDYILWAGGDPLGMVIVSAIVSNKFDGKVNFLSWSRVRNDEGQRVGGYYELIKLKLLKRRSYV